MLRTRQRESQRGFYRAIAGGSSGATLFEREGVVATLVPAREWFSVFNSAFYDRVQDLDASHQALTDAYEAAGVKSWAVWVPPGDSEAAALLDGLEHHLDSSPMLFAAPIEELDLPATVELDLEPHPTWRLVAEINDRAHGVLEPWSMAAVFETMDDPASRLHVARHDGAPASALIAREHEGECYFWFVATVPEARRVGLAAELMRHALRESRERGCTTTSLESTQMAEALYARLGYRALGRYEMWERRAG